MGHKYFGTDGIRGRVGEEPITADSFLRIGHAIGRVMARDDPRAVVIGKDTRISGYMFESALEAGLAAAGANVALLGPMPTPAVAYLTRTLYACAGIVISASHNPYYDNGIKLFSDSGQKLADDQEAAIAGAIDQPFSTIDSEHMGKASRIADADGRYIEFCKGTIPFGSQFNGLRVVVDCAHGSTYRVGPSVMRELGIKVLPMAVEPDGLNINRDCGSTHPQAMQARVVDCGADLGIAFDGDGDRVLMADEEGELVDGDQLLYIIAMDRHARGQLSGDVVGTVMSNLGLEQALNQAGIGFQRAPVGDRFIHQRLVEAGGSLGGEASGHLLCLDRTSTGDGIVSALQVLEVMARSGRSLKQLASGMSRYPQTMINVPVSNGAASRLQQSERIQQAVADTEQALSGQGRVILRPSGTEPLVRVTLEGRDGERVARLAQELADVVASELGQSG